MHLPCGSGFNPRARTGRDVRLAVTHIGADRFQSTRPHGARRRARNRSKLLALVSIHAPARGATAKCLAVVRHERAVSIHAPARGATVSGERFCALSRCFNPRARTGRDAAA